MFEEYTNDFTYLFYYLLSLEEASLFSPKLSVLYYKLLPHILCENELISALSRLCASIKSSDIYFLFPFSDNDLSINLPTEIINNKLIVTNNYHKFKMGDEILSINDVDTGIFLKRLKLFIPHHNSSTFRKIIMSKEYKNTYIFSEFILNNVLNPGKYIHEISNNYNSLYDIESCVYSFCIQRKKKQLNINCVPTKHQNRKHLTRFFSERNHFYTPNLRLPVVIRY